ncbi:hypothetical protein [Epilithonimonas sp.]|uniref:hypothetical protein n=1 Tax=Epilithonimonas sp. TaxID=2894511 RepID=UPI00289B4716|nr:hypothetical protein [Epilithonimonas sp.]
METENLQPQQTNSKQWYDNKFLLIVLFFLLPPLGIYGMVKRKTATWKKVLYIIPSSFMILYIPALIYTTFFIDNYKEGIDSYNKKDYKNADYFLRMVKPDDVHYKDALAKIAILKPKIDSVELEKRQKEIAESNKKEVEPNKLTPEEIQTLKDFQTKWSEKIVKDWQGDYFKNSSVSKSGDTIKFELIKIASTGNWQSSAEMNREIYQKEYDSLLKQNFNNKYNLLKTKVVIIPDSGQQKINEALADRKRQIKVQFSAWDGSHRELKRLVKSAMNDPSSFEHVNTTYKDKGDYIIVQMSFRGKNAFGATVLNGVTAKADLNGNILSVSKF